MNQQINNTFNLTALEETLHHVKFNAYHTLLEAQRTLTGYRRYDFKMSQIKKAQTYSNSKNNVPQRYILTIEDDFISSTKRELYKRSKIYGKELTLFDVANNPNVFSNLFMVFIDGKFIDSLKIRCQDDRTEIVFSLYHAKLNPTGIPLEHFDKLVRINAPISIIFMANGRYGAYQTNINVINQYQNNLSLQRFGITDNPSDKLKYITFINTNKLLFESVITETVNSGNELRFFNNNQLAYDTKIVHLNIFGFNNLVDVIEIRDNAKFFSLPVKEMPVPVENLMVFKVDSKGMKKFAHDVKIKLHYPNVYEITNNFEASDLSIYVFYSENRKGPNVVPYENEMFLHQQLYGELSPYLNENLSSILVDYMPEQLIYSIKDYHGQESTYKDNHLQYKIDKMKEAIEQNPEALRLYLQNILPPSQSTYIDCDGIDLSIRVRYNNHLEIKDAAKHVTFNTPHYLFVIRKQYENMEKFVRLFVDGQYRFSDFVFGDDKFVYMYFPTSIITDRTIIEIEKFLPVKLTKTVTFTSSQRVIEIISNHTEFNTNHIYLVDSTTKEFLPRSAYTFLTDTTNGTLQELPNESYTILDGNVFVRIEDVSYFNTLIDIIIEKPSYYTELKIHDRDDIGKILRIPTSQVYTKDSIRIFRNGRLLPQNTYAVNLDYSTTGDSYATSLALNEIGDIISLDAVPYHLTGIYYSETLSEKGSIDLSHVLKRPFDLKWHDVYVNGQKINFRQIEIISPTLIFINNVDSRKDVYVMERTQDEDYFVMHTDTSLNRRLWDSYPNFKIRLNDRPSIEDLENDNVTHIYHPENMESRILYEMTEKTNKFINPDIPNLPVKDLKRYKYIIDETSSAVLIDPDDLYRAPSRMKVFPEIT